MKKILSLVLALMMVASVVAFADTNSPVAGPQSPSEGSHAGTNSPSEGSHAGTNSPVAGNTSPVAGSTTSPVAGAFVGTATSESVKALKDMIANNEAWLTEEAAAALKEVLNADAGEVNDVLEVYFADEMVEGEDIVLTIGVESPYTVGEKLAIVFVCIDAENKITGEYVSAADVIAENTLETIVTADTVAAIKAAAATAMVVLSAAE